VQDLLGRRLEADEMSMCLGLPGKEGLESLGLPPDEPTFARWLTYMVQCWDDVHLFDGVPELLDGVASLGLELGCVTSETATEMERCFAPFGLMDRFACVVTASDTDVHKPNPDPLLAYLERSGAKAEETLYVGDAASDAECAEAAGVDFVQACWRPRPERRPLHELACFETPAQLLEWLSTDQDALAARPWLAWSRELQAIAQAGLYYTTDVFDRERFERVRSMAVELMSDLSSTPMERVRDLFADEDGYQTPKVDTRGAIFDDDGRICLVRERMFTKQEGGCWSLPGGWCDQGQTIYSNVVKECSEEAGLTVAPVRLIAVEEHNLHNPHPFAWGILKHFVLCRSLGGDFVPNDETLERGFFGRDELPDLFLSKNTPEQVAMCFAAYDSGDRWQTVVD
jgi:HAD superfamily hydrolase (TIGR01549 family)